MLARVFKTFTIGATLFVVHDALDTITSLSSSRWSLTPRTTVLILASLAGADSTTFLAPPLRCFEANSVVKNNPVHSTTVCTS